MSGDHTEPGGTLVAGGSQVQAPDRLVLPARFSGPPGSANGGYAAGRLAALVAPSRALGRAVEVTLRQPLPLDTAVDVVGSSLGARVLFGGALLADVRLAELAVDPIDPVSHGRAADLAATFAGRDAHPFPGCFVCGSDRQPPDGLGLRPGRVPDRADCTATAWVPDDDLATAGSGQVPAEIVWAALDCPGGWAGELVGRPAVLGRITAQVDALPFAGDRCVVLGRAMGRQGRKSFRATTLYDGDGRVLGRAYAVWIDVDPARLQPAGGTA